MCALNGPVRTPTNVVGPYRVSLASVDGGIKNVLKDNPHPRNTVELLRYDVQLNHELLLAAILSTKQY